MNIFLLLLICSAVSAVLGGLLVLRFRFKCRLSFIVREKLLFYAITAPFAGIIGCFLLRLIGIQPPFKQGMISQFTNDAMILPTEKTTLFNTGNLMIAATVLWAVVAVFLLIKLARKYNLSLRYLRKNRLYKFSYENLPVYRIAGLDSPMLAGIILPAVYIPDEKVPDYALWLAIRHEYCHFQRKDLVKRLVLEIVTSVCWFNPLLLTLKYVCFEYVEYACDETVTSSLDADGKREYARTVLVFADRGYKKSELATNLSSSAENLKRRIELIMRDGGSVKFSPFYTVIGVLAVMMSASVLCAFAVPQRPGAQAVQMTLSRRKVEVTAFSSVDRSDIPAVTFDTTLAEGSIDVPGAIVTIYTQDGGL